MNASNPFRMLVVDDNPFSREMLKAVIKQEGYPVEDARNGKEAIEKIRKQEFDLIFMDLIMPGMDGFETMQRIRAMGITTPIVIVSSMSTRQDRVRCLESGATDFLPKPIEHSKLKALLTKFIQNGHADTKTSELEPILSSSVFTFSDYHAMLVEEDDAISARFEKFLNKVRLDHVRVFNGSQALELFRENPYRFNVIISNIFTSGIDGLGILAQIKREFAGVFVFIYAREYDTDAFQLAIQLGADGMMTETNFENIFINVFESAIYQGNLRSSRSQTASTAIHVRKAQQELIKFGCSTPCETIDIAYASLTDAGGDVASCRQFNLAGRCGIVLGDVSGHSVLSSYISAFFLGILSSNWDRHQNPMDLLKTINTELNKSDYSNYHLCASTLLWDRCRKTIQFASAGIPAGLLVYETPEGHVNISETKGGGMCLGLLKDNRMFLTDDLVLDEDQWFFLFSDGIESEHIIEILKSKSIPLNRKSIRGISQEILEQIISGWGQDDDMILISIRAQKGFPPKEHHYAFPADYRGIDKACQWISDLICPEKIPKGHDPYFVYLAIREALNNAVHHGNKDNPAAMVDVFVFWEPGKLRVEISDEGPGFIIPETLLGMSNVDILQAGGRGLPIILSSADSVSVEGSTISMNFEEKTP